MVSICHCSPPPPPSLPPLPWLPLPQHLYPCRVTEIIYTSANQMTQCEILWQQASFLLLTFCDIAYAQVIDLRNKIFDEKTMKMTYVAL